MSHIYDENNLEHDTDQETNNEFDGFSVLDMNDGEEVLQFKETSVEAQPKKLKEENYDDGETVEASAIPDNEQTVMIDNANLSGLRLGDSVTLKIINATSIAVYAGEKKVGDFKPAFCQKLLETRVDTYVECSVYATAPFAMIKLKFFAHSCKNTVKIALP